MFDFWVLTYFLFFLPSALFSLTPTPNQVPNGPYLLKGSSFLPLFPGAALRQSFLVFLWISAGPLHVSIKRIFGYALTCREQTPIYRSAVSRKHQTWHWHVGGHQTNVSFSPRSCE